VFALAGPFKFHSVSLCGRLYPLPRRATFRFRNALHLIEARRSVGYVRGIFQRLLALLGKANLVADIRSRAGLVSFAIVFLPREHPPAHGRPGTLYHVGVRQLFQFLPRGLVDVFFRVDSAMRGSSISFLTRASVAWLDSCFGSFKCILARFHESKVMTSQFGTGLAVSELFSYRAVLNSLYQSANVASQM